MGWGMLGGLGKGLESAGKSMGDAAIENYKEEAKQLMEQRIYERGRKDKELDRTAANQDAINTAIELDQRKRDAYASDASAAKIGSANATSEVKKLGVGGSVSIQDLANLERNPSALAAYKESGADFNSYLYTKPSKQSIDTLTQELDNAKLTGNKELIDDVQKQISELRQENKDRMQSSTPSPNGNLSRAQQVKNFEIDKAREFTSQLSPEEIRNRTSKFSNTGRENPAYDPALANRLSIASRRKYGEDSYFDSMHPTTDTPHPTTQTAPQSLPTSKAQRFAADPQMKSYTLGKQAADGTYEVLDASGKLVGHYE